LCDERTEGDAGGCRRRGGDLVSSVFRITRARVVSSGLNDNDLPTDNRTTKPAGHYNNKCTSTIGKCVNPITIIMWCMDSSILTIVTD